MAVTTTFSLTSAGNLQANDFDSDVAITALSGGGFITAGYNPFTFVFTIDDIDLRAYDGGGTAGTFAGDATGGLDPAIVQLTNGNVVVVDNTATEVRFTIVDSAGVVVNAATLIGDTQTSNADVAQIRGTGLFGLGAGFVIASQDNFTPTDNDIQLDFYSNTGTAVNTRIVDGSPADDRDAKVVQLDNGNVAVAWTRLLAGGDTQVMYAVYNRDGTTVVQGPTVLDNTGPTNRDVAIVATDAGFAVLYEEFIPGSGFGFPTANIKLASIDGSGAVLGSKVLVSASVFGAALGDIDVTRMQDGLLAFSYTSSSLLSSDNVLVRIAGQAHDDTTLSGPLSITGGASADDDALQAAITAFGSGQLAVIYENATTGGSNGEHLAVTRVQTGDAADDTMTGGLLRDSFIGGDGIDTVDYSSQLAAVTVHLADNTATGGGATGDTFASVENLIGGNSSDSLTGNGAANRLAGGAGTDTLDGRDGNDILIGGAGADILRGGATSFADSGGIDTVDYSASDAAVTVDLALGTGTGGHAQGDTLFDIERIIGSAFGDTLTGTGGRNSIDGGTGDDRITGLGGIDVLAGWEGNDSLNGGAGRDTLSGEAGSDSLLGGGGGDRLFGGDADDFLFGGGARDRLFGEDGNDRMEGGGGIDTLDGSAGNDRLFGGGSGDRLLGEGGNDTLDGGTGTDFLDGSSGNDTLIGGGQADRLFGGIGLDRLDGGTGNDTLDGGAGADVYVFGAGYGRDRVVNFEDGIDRVDLVLGLNFAQMTETAIAGGVRLTLAGVPGLSLDLLGVTTAQITAADFI